MYHLFSGLSPALMLRDPLSLNLLIRATLILKKLSSMGSLSNVSVATVSLKAWWLSVITIVKNKV